MPILPLFSSFFFSGFFILSVAILTLVFGLFFDRFIASKNWLQVLIIFFGACIIILALQPVLSFGKISDNPIPLIPFLLNNTFTTLAAALLSILYAGCVAVCFSSIQHRCEEFETVALLLFSFFGGWLVIFSHHLLTIYMGLEIQSLCFYVLLGMGARQDPKSSEAAIKYFILGSLSSCFLLFGIALFYGFMHTFDLTAHSLTEAQDRLMIAIVFIFAALAFKVSAAPFHMWTLDVFEGASLLVVTLLSLASKLVGLCVLVKFLYGPLLLFPNFMAEHGSFILRTMGVLSIVWGALGALQQHNLKRIIGYSSISHMGFMLLALSVQSSFSLQSVALYITLYSVTLLGLWACLACVQHNGRTTFSLNDLSCLAHQNPFFASLIAIFLFSLAGIPPFSGFFAKFFVFQTLLQNHAYTTAILAAVLATLGAVYYLRVIKVIYLDEPKVGHITVTVNQTCSLVIFFTVLITVAFFLYPSLILRCVKEAAASMSFA